MAPPVRDYCSGNFTTISLDEQVVLHQQISQEEKDLAHSGTPLTLAVNKMCKRKRFQKQLKLGMGDNQGQSVTSIGALQSHTAALRAFVLFDN